MIRKFTIFYTVCVISFLAVYGCDKKTTISEVKDIPGNEPDQEFLASRIVITEHGITNAIVQAESINVYSDKNLTSIDGGVMIDFFDNYGKKSSTLTAKKGNVWGLYDKVDSLKATGDVVIISADKDKRMETSSSLCWISSARKIYAPRDSLVKLITNDGVEQGINFNAKDDLSEYSMENVSGVFEGEEISLPGR